MQTPQNSSDFVLNISLSSDRVQHNITHALAEWKSTRALLSNVIQSYVAICVALQNFCTIPTHHPDGQSLVTDTLATVQLELESLALEEATLRDMRVSLTTTVNNSTRLASINRLPFEILARIFEFSNTYCICHDGYRMNGVAGVCVYWRQVALDTPRLWTHVDIIAAAPHELSHLLLSRSESLPLHIHILDSQRGSCIYGVNDEPGSEYLGESVMIALEFYLDRICTLNIESSGIEGDLIFSVLNLWSKHGNAVCLAL
ncbi:hypothetical protein FRC12_010867 [Ceratobasidium sp. 428]|nr:hypothetical protein FRC12_010867 [Ceratobasidium sp. 428]